MARVTPPKKKNPGLQSGGKDKAGASQDPAGVAGWGPAQGGKAGSVNEDTHRIRV